MNIAEPVSNREKVNNLINSPEGNESSTPTISASLNPFSILSIVSMLNRNIGPNSPSSFVATLTSLIGLLPLNQYFPGVNQLLSSNLIATLPQLIKLIETVSSFDSLVSYQIIFYN